METHLNPCKKHSGIPPGCLMFDLLFTAALFLTGLSFGRFLLELPLPAKLMHHLCPEKPALHSLNRYLCFLGVWILIGSAMLLTEADRKLLFSSPICRYRKKNLTGFLIALAAGFAANGVCVFGAQLTGSFTLHRAPVSAGMPVLFFLAILIQAGAEEFTFRFFLYQKLLQKNCNPSLAVAGNVLLFLVLHLMNAGLNMVGALQIVLMGILLSLLAADENKIWEAIAFHTAWNASQSLLFGLKNSGTDSVVSFFLPESVRSGFFYDAAFGVEGSIGACLVLFLTLTALLLYRKATGKPIF